MLSQVVFVLWALTNPLGLMLMDYEIDEKDLIYERGVPYKTWWLKMGYPCLGFKGWVFLMASLLRFIWERITKVPWHGRLMAHGYWIFQGPKNFISMSRNCVSSMGIIVSDLDIYNIFPLSTVTWKLHLGKAWALVYNILVYD